jgi:integrase
MSETVIKEPFYQEQHQRWRISYKDTSGQWKSAYAKCQKKAMARYKQLEVDLKAGEIVQARGTFERVAKEALDARALLVGKKNGLRPQSHANDERHLRLYLLPEFRHIQMRFINTGMINLFIDKMAAEEIAPKTQRHIIGTLNMVCKYAVAKAYLSMNPCAKSERQQIRGSMGERAGYHLDEVQAMLSQKMKPLTRALISTAAFTGLAANELQGLQWKDVDLYQGTITVARTGFRFMVQNETKTEYRLRSVPMPSNLIRVLREWQLQCHSQIWVFPTVGGRMGEQNAWRKLIATVCRHAGVDDKGLGGFRKFYHTQMEMAGVPESIRKYRMGHSKKSNTAKIHYTDADIKAAMSVEDIETIAAKLAP